MVEITKHDRYYFNYEYNVTAKYLIPLLIKWNIQLVNSRLLDVGCGDGGGIAAFHDSGMKCFGFDYEPRRIELALKMIEQRSITLLVGDINNNPLPFNSESFDLVVLHDVFEHLEQKIDVLKRLKRYLSATGKLLITFPPYYSAYGGHQQLLQTWFAKLPFIHLIPFMCSHIFPRLKKEHKLFVQEIQKLAKYKMGIGKFEKYIHEAGLIIEKKQSYLISPNHIRFGLKPLGSNIISKIPLVREILISGVVYLLTSIKGENKN